MQSAKALRNAREAWLARPQTAAVFDQVASYAAGAKISACPALEALMCNRGEARAFIETLVLPIINALKVHPFGEPAFRFRVSSGLARIELVRRARATLSLAVYEPLAQAIEPASAFFSDREVHEIVIEGEASGLRHHYAGEGVISSIGQTWRAGDRISLVDQVHARQVLRVERAFVLLELAREPARPAPAREVDLETGRTTRLASGDKSASQAIMALSVLGALGDSGAPDAMENIALRHDEAEDVRWEAVRQALALEPARGLAILAKLAAQAADPLAQPARSLRASLLREQPELRALAGNETA